jgi:hypothetical protein
MKIFASRANLNRLQCREKRHLSVSVSSAVHHTLEERAMKKSEAGKMAGRKMKRDLTTKDAKHAKEEDAKQTSEPQMDTDSHR